MKTVKTISIRYLPVKKRKELRAMFAKLVDENVTMSKIVAQLHIDERQGWMWKAQYRKEKDAFLCEKKRGPRKGKANRILNEKEYKKLENTIKDKTPDQMKFDFALWSSKVIKEFIAREYGSDVSRRTARRYMQKMGFSYQCPVRFAREQQPAQVAKWLDDTYPEIKRNAVKCGGKILWADELSVLTAETRSRGYSLCGIAPILQNPANRSIRCNMISAVSNSGEMQFMIFEGAMNVDIFKDFMTRLIKDASEKVFLIVDNLKVHHACCLESWLKERETDIELFYLPSYSPELKSEHSISKDKTSLDAAKRCGQ